METVQAVVVGAGAVGLAVARALALRGREVLLLDAASSFGQGASARNSEVIHAGIYYPPGSLKARLCVQGKAMLYAYAQERGIAHQRLGKLLVANTATQVAALPSIMSRAAQNGVRDLQRLTRQEAQALEPQLACEAAIFSPSTGIVDSHALMLSLLGDMEHAGGTFVPNTSVARVQYAQDDIEVVAIDGTPLRTPLLVNAAGWHACELASRIQGLAAQHVPRAYFAKGNYFSLVGRSPFKHLIYPVPEPNAPLAGLGVHLTLDLGGQAKFGPDVQWVDSPDDLDVDASRQAAFEAAVRQYWPALPANALQSAYAGIRPKISGPNEAAADFSIQGPAVHGLPGLVNLFGIESPGLTSCLAIGEMVSDLLLF
jgi:L-2-hydroxyglutarate oxidase LhgO